MLSMGFPWCKTRPSIAQLGGGALHIAALWVMVCPNFSTHRRITMRKLSIFGAILGLFVLAGCNTVQGVGQDVEKAGSKISEAAVKTGGTGTQ